MGLHIYTLAELLGFEGPELHTNSLEIEIERIADNGGLFSILQFRSLNYYFLYIFRARTFSRNSRKGGGVKGPCRHQVRGHGGTPTQSGIHAGPPPLKWDT
jgi:hypothetical protein